MAAQGPFLPGNAGSFSSASENNNDWTNTGNITADDNVEAQITAATYDSGDVSYALYARNFGFTIPAGATIDGVTVTIERRRFAGAAVDNDVRLTTGIISGDRIGTSKASGTAWPSTSSNAAYGGSSDVWGATLTPTIVNDAFFGVAISVQATAANTDIGIDKILMTVFYTEASSDVDGSGGLSFGFSTAGSGSALLAVDASGGLSFPFSTSSVAVETLEGAGGTTFPFSTASSGAEGFDLAGGLSFPFSTASAGELALVASGGASFPFLIDAAGNVEADDSVFGAGDLAFPFSTSAAGEETLAGAGALSFGFVPAATGEETLAGAGDLAFVFSATGAGSQGEVGSVAGAGALSFGFNSAAAGAESLVGSGALAVEFSVSSAGLTYVDVSGVAAAAFSMTIDGVVNLPIREVAGDVLFLLRDKGRPRYPWSRSGFPRR